jgi:iron complex transport system substrate-binding protein
MVKGEGTMMHLDRRRFLTLLSSCAVVTPAAVFAAGVTPSLSAQTVIDAVGRSVRLNGLVRRIVLLDARDVLSMAVIDPDPTRHIVGWASVETFDSDLVRRQYEIRPDGSAIPAVGALSADSLSVERILALEPDLVVATALMEPQLGQGPLARRLEAAGIPLVFSSAASNQTSGDDAVHDPFTDLAVTLRMWGVILGNNEKAEAFIAFVHDHLARVSRRLGSTAPTTAYLEIQSTYDDCCWVAGNRIWGDLLTLAGGRTLSAVDAPWYAKIALEQLMTEAPEVYIASGGAFGAGSRPGIGPGLDHAAARTGLRRLVDRTGLDTLPAVGNGRVHGVWTGLLTVPPLNILFVEVAAKWLHPEMFTDMDPADTLAEINQRFLAKPLSGPCWLSLAPVPNAGGG